MIIVGQKMLYVVTVTVRVCWWGCGGGVGRGGEGVEWRGEIKMRRRGGGGLVLVGGGFYLCQICVGHFFFFFFFSTFFCSILGCRFVSVDDVGVEEGRELRG